MPTRVRRRSRFTFLLLPLLFGAVTAYFAWQSTRGDFSSDAREALLAERMERQAVLAELVAQREVLEERVQRLRASALDADLLDERARAKLFVANPDELVILHNETEQTHLAAHNR